MSVLDPLEVKKSAQEILSEPELFDSEFGYFELAESYFLRRLKCAFSLIWSRLMPLIITLIVSALVGIYEGQAFATIWAGIVSGIVVLIVGLILILTFHYLFSAPKQMDDTLRGNLEAARKQLLEEKRKAVRAVSVVEANYIKCFDELLRLMEHKLTFEVDTEPFRSQVRLNRFDDNNDDVDDPLTRTYSLEAELRIRFRNADASTRGVTALKLSIVTKAGRPGQQLSSEIVPLTIQHPNESNKNRFTGLRVEGSDTTVFYVFVFHVNLPTECASSLDGNSFLRITMEATRQDPLWLEYAAPWKRAEADGKYVSISPRRAEPENGQKIAGLE